MAYVSKEQKAVVASELKKVIPSEIKWSLSIRENMVLVLKIRKIKKSFICDVPLKYLEVNGCGYSHSFLKYLINDEKLVSEIERVMNVGNYNNSEPECDYYDVGFYVNYFLGDNNKAPELV